MCIRDRPTTLEPTHRASRGAPVHRLIAMNAVAPASSARLDVIIRGGCGSSGPCSRGEPEALRSVADGPSLIRRLVLAGELRAQCEQRSSCHDDTYQPYGRAPVGGACYSGLSMLGADGRTLLCAQSLRELVKLAFRARDSEADLCPQQVRMLDDLAFNAEPAGPVAHRLLEFGSDELA